MMRSENAVRRCRFYSGFIRLFEQDIEGAETQVLRLAVDTAPLRAWTLCMLMSARLCPISEGSLGRDMMAKNKHNGSGRIKRLLRRTPIFLRLFSLVTLLASRCQGSSANPYSLLGITSRFPSFPTPWLQCGAISGPTPIYSSHPRRHTRRSPFHGNCSLKPSAMLLDWTKSS